MDTKREEPQRMVPRTEPHADSMPVAPPASTKSSGRYRLRAQHIYGGDRPLDEGTEVGTDTSWPWPGPPSPLMEGVDEDGKAAVKKLHNDLYDRDPPWAYDDKHPEYMIHEERRKEQEKETESDPVSYSQAMERGKEWEGDVPQPAAPRSIGGSRVAGVSMPATKAQNPNEEQYPKG